MQHGMIQGGGTNPNFPFNLQEDFLFIFEINLVAGDTIVTTQDSGTNANFKFQAVVEEFNI